MKIHIYITIYIFYMSDYTFAQNVPHRNFWSRFSFCQPISEKGRAEAELQQTKNLFHENLISCIRTQVHYQHNDSGFSFSPTYYANTLKST